MSECTRATTVALAFKEGTMGETGTAMLEDNRLVEIAASQLDAVSGGSAINIFFIPNVGIVKVTGYQSDNNGAVNNLNVHEPL